MARPSTLTPEVQALIASSRAANPARLLAELRAAGVQLSGRTLRRHLAKAGAKPMPAHMAVQEPSALVVQRAVAALDAGDDLAELHASAREVAAARAAWVPTLGCDARSVRAFATLARLGADLAKALAELAPAPAPDPEHDPANVKAKARLLAMVDEVLAR